MSRRTDAVADEVEREILSYRIGAVEDALVEAERKVEELAFLIAQRRKLSGDAVA